MFGHTSGKHSKIACCPVGPLMSVLLLACLAFASFNFNDASSQADTDVVRVNTDLVILNVTVTDKDGNYVHGLKRSDFKIFEDRRGQSVSIFTAEETPFAAAILLDTSGSMETRVTLARSAAIRFLDGLREKDVAAVYRFDSKVEQLQDFSPSRDLSERAFGVRAKGMTALNDAIFRAAKELSERPEKRRAIVVLSDGADTLSSATAEKALANALAAEAAIYGVDMSSAPGAQPTAERQRGAAALRRFAARSGGRYISTPGGQQLRESFASIVEELSNQYTIGYQPTNRSRDGKWREIEVALSKPGLSARTRKGYNGPRN